MRADEPSRTAEAASAIRALESLLPAEQRLFQDDYAHLFLKPWHRALLSLCKASPLIRDVTERQLDRRFPGVPADFICRTRYIDGLLTAALKEGVFPERVVTLGAGYDTRAFRLSGGLAGQLHFVEVDHAATQARKVCVVRRFLSPAVLERTVWVRHDLASAPEASPALGTALEENARTFWIAEGLFSYLPRESVQRLLEWIGGASTPGSQLVFTYVERELVERRATDAAAKSILRYLDEAGESFLSGWTPAEMAVDCGNAGLQIHEDLSETDLYARYLAPRGRRLGVVKQFRIVSARVEQL